MRTEQWRFGRQAAVIAVPYLCAAAALFAGMWAREEWDDYAGWVPVIVGLQAVWCAILGRPARELTRGRLWCLKAWAGTIAVLSWFGVVAAVMARVGWWSVFLMVVVVAPAVNVFVVRKQWGRGVVDTSTASVNLGLLMSMTVAAVISGMVAAASLWSVDRDAGILDGLPAALLLLFDLGVIVWSVGPWLWTLAVRLPKDEQVPMARVVRDGR